MCKRGTGERQGFPGPRTGVELPANCEGSVEQLAGFDGWNGRLETPDQRQQDLAELFAPQVR
jgi:hypothetical protein